MYRAEKKGQTELAMKDLSWTTPFLKLSLRAAVKIRFLNFQVLLFKFLSHPGRIPNSLLNHSLQVVACLFWDGSPLSGSGSEALVQPLNLAYYDMMKCLSLLFKLLVHQSKAQIIRFKTDLRGHIQIDFCNLFSVWEEKVNVSMDICVLLWRWFG